MSFLPGEKQRALREAARDCGRIRVLTVGPLLAKAIKSIHLEDSVSKLFV